jgi:hypothetical protein
MGFFGFFSGVGKFLGGNWIRIVLIAGLAASIFGMGYMKASAVHAEHAADFEKAKVVAIAAREKELRDEFAVRVGEEEAARITNESERNALRIHRDSLIEAIKRTQLTKPVTAVRVEACMESDNEDVQIVIANPFNESFRELWNDGSRGTARLGENP